MVGCLIWTAAGWVIGPPLRGRPWGTRWAAAGCLGELREEANEWEGTAAAFHAGVRGVLHVLGGSGLSGPSPIYKRCSHLNASGGPPNPCSEGSQPGKPRCGKCTVGKGGRPRLPELHKADLAKTQSSRAQLLFIPPVAQLGLHRRRRSYDSVAVVALADPRKARGWRAVFENRGTLQAMERYSHPETAP